MTSDLENGDESVEEISIGSNNQSKWNANYQLNVGGLHPHLTNTISVSLRQKNIGKNVLADNQILWEVNKNSSPPVKMISTNNGFALGSV